MSSAALATPGEPFTAIRFDLIDLETFLCVVDLGSFTLASKRLCTSQPTITNRVQRLESALRVKLLTRTTRSVLPTPEGAQLYDEATALLKGMRALVRRFEDTAERQRARIVVASTPGIAANTMPPIIRAYCDRFSDVQIELIDRQYEDVLACIDAHQADLAVIAFDGDSRRFAFEFLAEEEMVLVAPAQHPLSALAAVTLDQLLPYTLMTLARYATFRDRVRDELERLGLPPTVIRTTENLGTLLGMVDAGNVLAFLPSSMAHGNARSTRVPLELKDVTLLRRYGILTARNVPLSAAALSFCRHLKAEFPRAVGKTSTTPAA